MRDTTADFHLGGALDTESRGGFRRGGDVAIDRAIDRVDNDIHDTGTYGAAIGESAGDIPMTDRADGGTIHGESDHSLDHFIQRGDRCFAGTHLIVDLWDADRLDDIDHVEATLRACVAAAGATLLHIHLHHFTPNGGVSGVAVLAESHISIHSWPERSYAALDVFMCGDSAPEKAIPVLEAAFGPSRVDVTEHLRGEVRVVGGRAVGPAGSEREDAETAEQAA